MSIKRHFYKDQHYVINKEDRTVTLLPEFHKQLLNKSLWGRFGFKKIGGSSLGDVLMVDQYKSQFVAFCRMAWIGLPILDRKYVDAGIAIEPKVTEVLRNQWHKEIETYPGEKYNFDYFSKPEFDSKTEGILGGLPDGYIEKDNFIIEIKTTGEKNYEKWAKWGVPAGYIKQAQMYSYLIGAPKFAIVATFLKEEDYKDPSNYPIKDRKMKAYPFEVNLEQVMDDAAKVKEFHRTYSQRGVSPQYDERKDAELLEYLECSNEAEWEALQAKWTAMGKIPA